jgi:hypothetical protein
MKMTDKHRGIFFLCMGVLFPLVFLFGGGVVTATNGG